MAAGLIVSIWFLVVPLSAAHPSVHGNGMSAHRHPLEAGSGQEAAGRPEHAARPRTAQPASSPDGTHAMAAVPGIGRGTHEQMRDQHEAGRPGGGRHEGGQAGEAFPGIPWGARLAMVRRQFALERASSEGRVERYTVPLERLGKAEIQECQLEFTDGRFSGILITTSGATNTRALFRYLTGRFGPGADDGNRFWQWMAGDTYVSLDEDSAGDGNVLWYGIHWQGEKAN